MELVFKMKVEREVWERMRRWMYAEVRKRNKELLSNIKRIKRVLERFKNENKNI